MCFIAVQLTVIAQQETKQVQSVAATFEGYYNNSRYDSIFNMFSSDMKQALPLQQTRDFFAKLMKQAGKITAKQFIKYEQSYVSYKATFERAILTLTISINNTSFINGLFVKPYTEPQSLSILNRNVTKLILPFKDEWTVIWGGDTKELNYHVANNAQRNAFDIVVASNGKSFRTDGAINTDYYAFGKEIIAPCEGEIVLAIDGIKDNKPGVMNPMYVTGNSVILKTANNEYFVFAHFKQFSVKVKEGQKVKQGDILGLCGNSGNSSEAHLHFHIQNVEDMNVATGAKCYFENILVNGKLKNDYSPVKSDLIKNP
jgi:murein DD-endopeptidase MepM/ murein hydrolase activator NlpD